MRAVVVLVVVVAGVVLSAYREVKVLALKSLYLFFQEFSRSCIWIISTYISSFTLEFEITHESPQLRMDY